MDMYRYEVRRNGTLIFVSEPMALEAAEEQAAARVEPGITAQCFEDEPFDHGATEAEWNGEAEFAFRDYAD